MDLGKEDNGQRERERERSAISWCVRDGCESLVCVRERERERERWQLQLCLGFHLGEVKYFVLVSCFWGKEMNKLIN
jgi:hypothetical protein